MRQHKTYEAKQQMSSFRLKDIEKVNRVQGLAALSDIEIIKRQNLLAVEAQQKSDSVEIKSEQVQSYKQRLFEQYRLEMEGNKAVG